MHSNDYIQRMRVFPAVFLLLYSAMAEPHHQRAMETEEVMLLSADVRCGGAWCAFLFFKGVVHTQRMPLQGKEAHLHIRYPDGSLYVGQYHSDSNKLPHCQVSPRSSRCGLETIRICTPTSICSHRCREHLLTQMTTRMWGSGRTGVCTAK